MTRHIYSDEVDDLAVDLRGAPRRMNGEQRKVTRRSATKVKAGMRRDFSGIQHAPHIPRAINYDIFIAGDQVTAEIGVDKDGPQGPLGNILAYGSVNNAPVVDHTAALRRELPIFIRDLAAAADNSVLPTSVGRAARR